MEAKTKKSSTTSETIAPGIYRLTADMPALFPDKRFRGDWRAAPMKAGTLFAVRDEPKDCFNLEAPKLLYVSQLHSWGHRRVLLSRVSETFLENLESVEVVAVSEYLAFVERVEAAPLILDLLQEKGLLTTAGVHRLLQELVTRETEVAS